MGWQAFTLRDWLNHSPEPGFILTHNKQISYSAQAFC